MFVLKTVSKPAPTPALEALEVAQPTRVTTLGNFGQPCDDSRSLKYLGVTGKSDVQRTPPGNALESVIGIDERTRILDTDLAPWRMICALRMRSPAGGIAIGTGWLISPKTVLTAGHCVFSSHFFGGWADSIEVSPGRNGADFPYGTVTSGRFSTVDRWKEKEDQDFDIGCIHLDEPIGLKTGWFALGALTPSELLNYQVNVSGYPADRGAGAEQYHHRNRVLQVGDRRVFYDVDTYGGQSGAPVWIHETKDSPPLAIGIHAYGATSLSNGLLANSAPRLLPEVLEQIRLWVDADGGWPPEG